jgi:hypothetical protein
VLILLADALLLRLAAKALPDAITVGAFGDALLAALVIAAVSLCLQIVLGTKDSSADGAVVLGREGATYLEQGRVDGVDPLAPFSPTAARHLLRTASPTSPT